MRAQLETIFENLYNGYGFRPIEFPNLFLVDSIQKVIQEAEEDYIGNKTIDLVKIRSDAKYFLVIIFNQMVELPLRLENSVIDVKGISSLDEDILFDIRYLLTEGFKVKANAEVKEITAHTILTLMDVNWNRLHISKFELWNKK